MTLIFSLQGERVAELILHHARANECQNVPQFKKEMAQLVDHALSNTLSLGKVLTEICALLLCLVCVSDAGPHDNGYHDGHDYYVTIFSCRGMLEKKLHFEFCYPSMIVIAIIHHGLISIFFSFIIVLCLLFVCALSRFDKRCLRLLLLFALFPVLTTPVQNEKLSAKLYKFASVLLILIVVLYCLQRPINCFVFYSLCRL